MIVRFATETDGDAQACVMRSLINFRVDINYTRGTSPYCENPVEIVSVDEDNDVVVCEVDDETDLLADGATWAIPLDAIRSVTVL